MEELRWILLGVGIVIVVAVYFWGRTRKRETNYSSYVASDEVPSFSASDESDNGWRDGVGPVRVVQGFNDEEIDSFNIDESIDVTGSDTESRSVNLNEEQDAVEPDVIDQVSSSSIQPESVQEEVVSEEKPKSAVNDVVALYLVAQRGSELKGEQILSSTFATQLEYGQMNIFHRKNSNGEILFSMSNMMEPGSFDIDHMHEMTTRGMSLFIQLSLCDDPVKALDDMLICAHSLASMLGAQLCDQNRQLLNESFTKALREKAKGFANN
jgi:cell division protein ZipA